MAKHIMILWLAGFFCLGTAPLARAATVEELEKEGLSHFREAFYEAMPQGEIARAEAAFARAEKNFREAMRQDPGRVEPYLYLGRTLFVQKKYEQAAVVYEEAVRIRPERKETYLQLASAHEMAGAFEKAVDTLEKLRQKERDGQAVQVLDELIGRLRNRIKDQAGIPVEEEGRHD